MTKSGKQRQKKASSTAPYHLSSRGRSEAQATGGVKKHDLQQRRKVKSGAAKARDEQTRDEINGDMDTFYGSLQVSFLSLAAVSVAK